MVLSAVLIAIGATLFGHFEVKTPPARRLAKWAMYLGGTALLSRKAGRPWSFLWIIGLPSSGLAFHFRWRRKNGIHPLTAEPRDRYYQLRGWSQA
jgi:hypothetical protein